jgi:flagella basal body P-ring formation protein FlgA
MLGHNSRITMTVIPLESGSKGQLIRVRDPANERLLTAEVVAEGLLRASF